VSVLHEDPSVLDELAYAIGRCDGIHLAGLSEIRGDGVVLSSPASFPRDRVTRSLVVLSTGDPLADARAGFAAGARGLLRWPDDAAQIAAIVASAGVGSSSPVAGGRVVVFAGARGGAGTTTIACLFAASIESSLLVDLSGGGQLAFAADDAGGSLERALASPLPDVVAELCEAHAAGRALLPRATATTPWSPHVVTLVAAARRIAPVVVVDGGREAPPVDADVTYIVCAADVASVRAARALADEHPIVVTHTRASGLSAKHVAKALGRAPVAVMPADRRLARAADVGLLPRRPRRRIRRFVHALRAGAGV
jgi:hypothetical protein